MSRYQRLLGVLLFLGAMLAIFEFSGLRDHFTLAYLRQTILTHEVGGLLIFVAVFSLGNLVHIPGWIFLASAVLALGAFWGGVVTYIAAVISCGVTFFSIRFLGGDALREMKNKTAMRIFRQLDARPVASVALLRVFFQTVPALNYTLALSGIRFRHYMIGTLLGLPLPITLYCVFFDTLAHLLKIT
ncbi:SNARE associated Golgi protein [Rugosibacter aromaticivorans]|uniref:TVP38/TMEM64 family membrane protein n=1 Tax=Rugosibacter aromaticivorans TaxID=1565605 RepID=A0A0C5J3L8_9PROT|nr:VTT domain-containing protein [Rugosibacter aromaticivorans]AJP49587.1 SNARE associated Golgi protein [Rugosibacter aromaticivorans]